MAALRARRTARDEETDLAADDDELDEEPQNKEDMEVDNPSKETADEDEEDEEMDDDEDMNDVLHNTSGLTVSDSDDDGFGELVADLVGSERSNVDGMAVNVKSPYRQSLYMTEKNKKLKETRVERKDKGKTRYTAYNMWAREHRKSNNFGKSTDMDYQAARRLHELWSNVSNKEKSAWKRKAKMQATRAKQRERAGVTPINKTSVEQLNQTTVNSTFINRPTTSRTRKLAEDKQKAKDESVVATPTTPVTKRTRNNSYRKNHTNAPVSNSSSSSTLYAATNGSTNNYNNSNKSLNNIKNALPAIEPIDAAAHLKLLGESLSIIGDRLKEHEGQIAVSGSLSVLLDSLLCSLGPLLCLTTRIPGLDKKPQLKLNLATTLDNIAYVMPGL